MPKKTGKEFIWTDDEVELLLNVTSDYKAKKAGESVDWESVRSKYGDILQEFLAALPDNNENILKDFPHSKEQITKQIVTSKLKAIRLKYRQAVDSGRRSGHGRVVLIFYELCEKVWGGSPATEQIEGGLETIDLQLMNDDTRQDCQETLPDGTSTHDTHPSQGHDTPNNQEGTEEGDGDNDNPTDVDEEGSADSNVDDPLADGSQSVTRGSRRSNCDKTSGEQLNVQQRRQLLDTKLDNYRQEKLKRKLPIDAQLVSCAREELEVKKRLVEQIDQMDKQYAKSMAKMSQNMEKLTNCVADGFTLLKTFMLPQPGPMYQGQPHYPQQYYPAACSPRSFENPPSYRSYPGSSSGNSSCPQSPLDLNASGMWEDS